MTEGKSGLRFSLREIRERQGMTAEVSVPASVLAGDAPRGARLSGPVEGELEFSVGGGSVLLQARLAGEWTLGCSRCLGEHRAAFSATVEETYSFSEETIDVTEDFRQATLLEVPSRSLCGPDCKGLCACCGANLNEGACGCKQEMPSRFEALRKLKTRAPKTD